VEQAETLSLPGSVVEYFQGAIGEPPGGFPEPLRSRVLKGRPLPDGRPCFEGRPGASLEAYDFDSATAMLTEKYGATNIREEDVLSHALYPKVFTDWKDFELVYGDVSALPTNMFLHPMKPGDEVELKADKGRDILVKMVSIGDADENGCRQVILELNGERWFVPITDTTVEAGIVKREKASPDAGSVGAPMPGVIVDVKVKAGDVVSEGDQLVVMSAMKMETAIPAPRAGVVARVLVNIGDKIDGEDLLMAIED